MSTIIQKIFYSNFRKLPKSVQDSISSRTIQSIFKHMVEPCIEQSIYMYTGGSNNLKGDAHAYVLSNIIAKEVGKRLKPTSIFKKDNGFELVQPSHLEKYRKYSVENDNYIGTYTGDVTAKQLIDDWS